MSNTNNKLGRGLSSLLGEKKLNLSSGLINFDLNSNKVQELSIKSLKPNRFQPRKYFNEDGVIGFIDDLKNITYEKFIEFKEKYFSIPDYIINVSKYKFKKDKNNKFNIVSYYSKPNEIPDESELIENNKISYESYSNFDENRIVLCYTFFNDYDYKKFIYHLIVCRYFNEGLTSPLYKNIREKLQCVYSISSRVKYINKNSFMYYTCLFTSNDKLNEVKNELIKLYKDVELDEERFNNIVTSIKLDDEKVELLDKMKFEDNNFDKKIKNIIKKMKFSFEDFKYYIKLFQSNKFYIIDDKELKEKCNE